MIPFGKRRCEVLKDIRKKVAKANGIKYDPVECTHEGDCPGTCPRCEAEVKYIEQELSKKMGGMKKAAAVLVGSTITVGALSLGSCKPQVNGYIEERLEGDVPCSIDSIDSLCTDSAENLEKIDTASFDNIDKSE